MQINSKKLPSLVKSGYGTYLLKLIGGGGGNYSAKGKCIDEKQKVQEKTKSVSSSTVDKCTKSANSNIRHETERIGDTMEQSDVKVTAQSIANSTSCMMKQSNDMFKVTDTVATAAVQ